MSDTTVTVHARLLDHQRESWAKQVKLRDIMWKKETEEKEI